MYNKTRPQYFTAAYAIFQGAVLTILTPELKGQNLYAETCHALFTKMAYTVNQKDFLNIPKKSRKIF